MTVTASGERERLSLKTKLAFGLGNTGEQIAAVTVSAYAMLYYNQVLGLPAHLAGLALSASLILDGLADPIAGSMSDRTRSRFGRRHIFMYLAAIPTALAFLAVFNPPSDLGQSALFWWFLASVGALRASLSFYETPHLALGGELSPNFIERSRVMSYNAFFGWVGSAGVTWIALSYFFKATPEYPRGLLNPAPWGSYSLVMGGAMLAILYASAWFTRDRIAHLPKPPPDHARFNPLEFFGDIGKAFANINYVWVLVAYFFSTLMIGLRGGLHLYTNTFFWGLTSEQLRFQVFGTFAGIVVAFVGAARLHHRFGKIPTILVATVIYAVGPSIPIWMGMAGVMEPGDPYVLHVIIAFVAINSATAATLTISVMSLLADIADENELRFGIRQEGVLYATRSFFGKIDQAIGAAFAGFVLTLIAFPVKAKVGSVPDDVLADLLLWDGVISIVPGLMSLLFTSRIKINRQTFDATRAALDARQGVVD